MNEKKINVHDLSRKVCSRVKEHETIRTTTVVTERKYKTHSGMKFKFDQKLKPTVPKPFSFDTGSKDRKASPCSHSPNRSESKHTNGETKGKGAKSEARTTTENLKIPKETRSCSKSRSVSRERVPNNATKIDDANKKPNSRCSRAAKPPTRPSNVEKPTVSSTNKTVKSETSNASKTGGKATKITKSRAQPSDTAKPQVHFSDQEKSGVKAKDCGSSSVSISKSEISAAEVASYISNVVITEENELKTKFNVEHPNEDAYKPEFLNGTAGMPFEFDSPESANGISLQSELASAVKVFETSISKSASKIPRKFAAHSGIKIHSNFKKETVAEQFDFESRSTNFKMANTKSEMNQVQINMVNN